MQLANKYTEAELTVSYSVRRRKRKKSLSETCIAIVVEIELILCVIKKPPSDNNRVLCVCVFGCARPMWQTHISYQRIRMIDIYSYAVEYVYVCVCARLYDFNLLPYTIYNTCNAWRENFIMNFSTMTA